MNQTDHSEPAGRKPEGSFYPLVSLLMVVIVASLAVLWMTERRQRQAAEVRAVEAWRRTGLPPGLDLLSPQGADAARQAMEGALPVRPVQREDLPRETAEFNGSPRAVLRISEQAGKRFGFQGGDVIVVGPAAEGPASAPSR